MTLVLKPCLREQETTLKMTGTDEEASAVRKGTRMVGPQREKGEATRTERWTKSVSSVAACANPATDKLDLEMTKIGEMDSVPGMNRDGLPKMAKTEDRQHGRRQGRAVGVTERGDPKETMDETLKRRGRQSGWMSQDLMKAQLLVLLPNLRSGRPR